MINAAYYKAPDIYWYQDGTEPNTFENFAVLTPMVNDFQCIPQTIVEETARQMFGDTVQVVHEKPRYGYYQEYAMGLYAPPYGRLVSGYLFAGLYRAGRCG